MKFTEIPSTTFQEIQLNAGILLSAFTPGTGTFAASNILGATTGGITFAATPTFEDFGADIDNCPKNTLELKKLTEWEAKMSGTFATVTADLANMLTGAADLSSTLITPRTDLETTDFTEIWWVGDYSNYNGDTNGGFVAIQLLNALSTGGFQIKSADKGKGQFSFEFTGHYSIEDQDTVPFNIYVQAGSAES